MTHPKHNLWERVSYCGTAFNFHRQETTAGTSTHSRTTHSENVTSCRWSWRTRTLRLESFSRQMRRTVAGVVMRLQFKQLPVSISPGDVVDKLPRRDKWNAKALRSCCAENSPSNRMSLHSHLLTPYTHVQVIYSSSRKWSNTCKHFYEYIMCIIRI